MIDTKRSMSTGRQREGGQCKDGTPTHLLLSPSGEGNMLIPCMAIDLASCSNSCIEVSLSSSRASGYGIHSQSSIEVGKELMGYCCYKEL